MLTAADLEQRLDQVDVAIQTGDPATIQAAVEQAHAAFEAAGDNPAACDERARLGELLYRAGLCLAAIDDLHTAVEQQRLHHGDGSWQVARSWRLIAMASLAVERRDDAIAAFERAIQIDTDSELARVDACLSAVLLGRMYVDSVEGRRALPSLRKALAWMPGDLPAFAEARMTAEDALGVAFLHLERLDAAEFYLERAVARSGEDKEGAPLEHAEKLLSLSQLYGRQHRFAYAIECARRCLDIRNTHLEVTDVRLGQAYLSLAALLNECEEWVDARAHYYWAQNILAPAGRERPYERMLATTGLLHTAIKMGELDDPEHDLEVLLDVAQELGPDRDLGAVQAIVDLAAIKERRGDTQASRKLASRAHAAGSEVRASEMLRLAFLDLAHLHIAHGNPAEAVAVLGWIAMLDTGRAQRLVDTHHFPQRILYSDDLSEATCELLRVVLQHLPHSDDALSMALRVVLERKALLTEANIAHNHRIAGLAGLGVDEHLARVSALRAQIRARLAEGANDGYKKLWAEVDTLRRELRVAESLLAGATDDLPDTHSVPDVDLAKLAARLAPDEVLVEYVALRPPREKKRQDDIEPDLWTEIVPDRYVVFLLHGGTGRVQLLDLGPAEPIERLVYSYIAAIHPSGAEEIARDRRAALETGDEAVIGAGLRRLIFDPLAPHLNPAARLRIAPDGALGAVSFALLPLEGDARLIDKFEVSYLSCGRTLLRQPPVAGEDPGPPVVVCDPDFDLADLSAILAKEESTPGFYFERLPHTAHEGDRVHARIGGELLTREGATRAEMLAVKSPAILHLATHGFFLPYLGRGIPVIGNWRKGGLGLWFRGDVLSSSDDPLVRDGLALAGVNGWSAGHSSSADAGDGLLASLDIARLDLRSTELVVLSSCSSARGTVRPGEGSAGILQSFESAGARRMVAALWAMPDHPATVTLIDRFYARVLAGDGVPAALRRAQRELKQLGAPPWAWGALVAYGDVAPLQWRPGE